MAEEELGTGENGAGDECLRLRKEDGGVSGSGIVCIHTMDVSLGQMNITYFAILFTLALTYLCTPQNSIRLTVIYLQFTTLKYSRKYNQRIVFRGF